MRPLPILVATTLATLLGATAFAAQQHAAHDMHQHAAAGIDLRQQVAYPPALRDHTLANMRDHLAAVNEILSALATGDRAEAARIAEARLGLDAPSADGCKAQPATEEATVSTPPGPDRAIAERMPEDMRRLGFEMHRAASEFATVARQTDAEPADALAALAHVTQQCTACHAAYRLH